MKAAVWHGRGDVRVEEVPALTAPRPGEVRIKVRYCGICGSDLHEYTSGPVLIPSHRPHPVTGRMAPVVLGHEFSGDVEAVGEGVASPAIGERVTALGFEHCGACYWCHRGQTEICRSVVATGFHRDGALTQYINVPAYTVHQLPSTMTYEQGALIEPLAVAVHAVKQGGVQPGCVVAILGAGPIGLSVLQAARAAGARRVLVLEIAERRKALATALGAEAVLDPREGDVARALLALTEGIGADVTFDCAGVPASPALAVELARRGGRVVIVAVYEEPTQLHFNRVVFFQKHIVGTIGYRDEFPATIALLSDGRLRAEPLITGKIGLTEIVERGFEALVHHKDENIKLLVAPDG